MINIKNKIIMVKELRKLVINEERHPVEQDILDAWDFANEKHCYVELKWFIPHYGWKVWFIDPNKNTLEELFQNLHVVKNE